MAQNINIEIPTNVKIDKPMFQKMLFITNALEKGWSVKKQTILIFLQKNTKTVEKYFKKII